MITKPKPKPTPAPFCEDPFEQTLRRALTTASEKGRLRQVRFTAEQWRPHEMLTIIARWILPVPILWVLVGFTCDLMGIIPPLLDQVLLTLGGYMAGLVALALRAYDREIVEAREELRVLLSGVSDAGEGALSLPAAAPEQGAQSAQSAWSDQSVRGALRASTLLDSLDIPAALATPKNNPPKRSSR